MSSTTSATNSRPSALTEPCVLSDLQLSELWKQKLKVLRQKKVRSKLHLVLLTSIFTQTILPPNLGGSETPQRGDVNGSVV